MKDYEFETEVTVKRSYKLSARSLEEAEAKIREAIANSDWSEEEDSDEEELVYITEDGKDVSHRFDSEGVLYDKENL